MLCEKLLVSSQAPYSLSHPSALKIVQTPIARTSQERFRRYIPLKGCGHRFETTTAKRDPYPTGCSQGIKESNPYFIPICYTLLFLILTFSKLLLLRSYKDSRPYSAPRARKYMSLRYIQKVTCSGNPGRVVR